MEIKTINVPENGIVKIFTAKGLDEKEQKRADDIHGAINTPHEYLSKRHKLEGVDKDQTHIEFSYEKAEITLVLNEFDHYSPLIVGSMIKTKLLEQLKINTGESWSCFDLADFFRLNRSIFADKADCAKLVTQLNNFKAKVEKDTELKKDNRANYDLLKRQVVESNLPEAFKICISMFKGLNKATLEVEIDISPATLDCILISPEIADKETDVCEGSIDEELRMIRELCPELPIIEV